MPLSESKFLLRQADATLIFALGEDAKAKEIRFEQGGGTEVAKRIK